MNVLDLFSGIGGISLGLERAGMRTVAFCEQDEYCRRVLARHWPDVPRYDDVRTLDATGFADIGLIAAGFPCQDISYAGKGAGLAGERSGLWHDCARLIRDVRPRWALLENVAALLSRGLGEVLGDLAALGYDAEWHCIPAAAVGAPHRRDRIWIAASDSNCRRRESEWEPEHAEQQSAFGRQPDGLGAGRCRGGATVADTASQRVEGRGSDRQPVSLAPTLARLLGCDGAGTHWREWTTEPALRGVDDGIPARLDHPRLHALGNSVVPQVVEMIGRAILAADKELQP